MIGQSAEGLRAQIFILKFVLAYSQLRDSFVTDKELALRTRFGIQNLNPIPPPACIRLPEETLVPMLTCMFFFV